MIKAIIFDFFGVIGQSTYRLIHEDFETSEDQNRQFKELHKALDYEFISQADFIRSYATILNIPEERMKQLFHDSKRRFSTSGALLDYIAELRKSYKIGLLSNITMQSYHEFIEPIKNRFDVIVTSYQTKLAKPERAIFELCAVRLGLDTSECIMIDDSFDNCEGARVTGMQAIQFVSLEDLKKQISELV